MTHPRLAAAKATAQLEARHGEVNALHQSCFHRVPLPELLRYDLNVHTCVGLKVSTTIRLPAILQELCISILLLVVHPISRFQLLVDPHIAGPTLVTSPPPAATVVATDDHFLPEPSAPATLVHSGTAGTTLKADLSIGTSDAME